MATPEEVNAFHTSSDSDKSRDAQHHTLGLSSTQASPGDHVHDGLRSKALLTGIVLTDLNSVINALVKLGATDGR